MYNASLYRQKLLSHHLVVLHPQVLLSSLLVCNRVHSLFDTKKVPKFGPRLSLLTVAALPPPASYGNHGLDRCPTLSLLLTSLPL